MSLPTGFLSFPPFPARWIDRVWVATLLAAPILGMITALSIAPLLGGGAAAVLILGGWRHLGGETLPRSAAAMLGAALIWALASCWWSEAGTAFAIKGLAQTFGVIVGGYVMVACARHVSSATVPALLGGLHRTLLAALIITLIMAVIARTIPATLFQWDERTFINYSLHFDRDMTILVLLFWPVLYGVLHRSQARYAVALSVLAGVTFLFNQSLAAKLAFGLGWIIWAIEHRFPTLGVKIVKVGVVAILLTFPLIPSHFPPAEQLAVWHEAPSSARHRMVIWNFVSNLIQEKPVVGWGYESSRILGHQQSFAIPNGPGVWTGEYLPLHPHNETLQVWLELGGIGALLLAVMAWSLIGQLQHPGRRHMAPYGAAMVAGTFIICNTSYGLWQSWWTSTIWLAAAALAALPPPNTASIDHSTQGDANSDGA